MQRQTYGYLPSRQASPPIGWYQIILLGVRGTRVLTTCPGCTQQRGGWDSNPRPIDHKSGNLPLCHRATQLPFGHCKTHKLCGAKIPPWRVFDLLTFKLGHACHGLFLPILSFLCSSRSRLRVRRGTDDEDRQRPSMNYGPTLLRLVV